METVNIDLVLTTLSGLLMLLVSVVTVAFWRRFTGIRYRWFWLGAALWTLAVALKIAFGFFMNAPVIGFMKHNLSYTGLVTAGGIFIGIESSVFEIGLTLLAVIIWHKLGHDANRAIGIGTGAGVFEALILAIACLSAVFTAYLGLPGSEKVSESIAAGASITPLFWLAGPVERVIAILCHASSRALVLLGVGKRKPLLVFWGFLIFTLLDAVAGAAHVSGKLGTFSMWWIELALLPFALISVFVLKYCYSKWGAHTEEESPRAVEPEHEGDISNSI